jgi:hypothetical protein
MAHRRRQEARSTSRFAVGYRVAQSNGQISRIVHERKLRIIPMHSVWNVLIDIMPVLGCAFAITVVPLLSDGPPGSRTEAEGSDSGS